MSGVRWLGVAAGVLFIIATASVLVASAFVPVLEGPDFLAGVVAKQTGVAMAAVFYIVAAFASVGIAISMYPVMRRSNPALALGSVVFRGLEGAFYMIGVTCLLSMVAVGQRFVSAGAADRAPIAAIGDALVSVRDRTSLLAVFAFCVGAFMYYTLFFRSREIPRWLSGLGVAAIVLMLVACMLALFADRDITSYVVLALPIGVQEIVLALWLIVKGFQLQVSATAQD